MRGKRTVRQRFFHFIRLFSFALIVALISIPTSWYCLSIQGRGDAKPTIRTVTIGRGTLTLTVNATGAVAADRTAKLSFDSPGIVTSIMVREGQRVLAGQLLARQDDQGYRLAVIQAEASLRAAQLSLEQLVQPPTDKDLAVALANVKAAKDSYNSLFNAIDPSSVKAAELRYQQAQVAYESAIQRRKDVGGQVGGKEDAPAYQLAKAQEGQASFAVEAARLQIDILKRGVDSRVIVAARARITLAETELERLKAGPLPVQVDQAKLRISQAETALAQTRRELQSTELRAPFAGEVGTINLRVGGLAINSGPIPGLTLLDRSRLTVNVNIDEIDIGSVSLDQLVTLTLDALPGESFSGKIARIAPAPNPATGTVVTYQVGIDLIDSTPKLKPGMTTSASVVVRQINDALRVPNSYVRLDRRNNAAYVNLVGTDGTLTEVPIVLGLRTEEFSELLGGLNEGDVIGVNLNSTINLFGGQ